MTVNFKSDANIGKFAILIVGIPSLALGLFSHFQSIWTKGLILIRPNIGVDLIPLYRVCDFQTHVADIRDKTCPNIALEQFYVAVIMICFAMSVLNFIIGFVVDLRTHQWKIVDTSYHLLCNLLLAVGGSLYLFSAVQIYNMHLILSSDMNHAETSFNFRTYEKLAAGCLTIMQAVLYGGVAHFIWKQK